MLVRSDADKLSKTTEQIILEAAEVEFMTKGYDGARTIGIAQKAGVTHAMLHYYFHTKESLFNRIFESKVSLMLESFFQILSTPEGSIEKRILDGMVAHFDFIAANPLLPRFVINEVFPFPERIEKIRIHISRFLERMDRGFGEEFRNEVRKGKLADVELPMLFLDIVSLNLFVFIAMPVASSVFQVKDVHAFLEKRKAENIEVIRRRLVKNV